MSRSDNSDSFRLQKEYVTKIPIKVIMYLTHIEKCDWPLFRDSPYNMFGRFIYHNLHRYPELIPYINKQNCNFEFIYEYITDQAVPIHTKYYYNDLEISEEEYLLHTQNTYYLERWIMTEPFSHKFLIFFECKYNPTTSIKDSSLKRIFDSL